MQRKTIKNKVLIIVVILGFVVVAGLFIHSQDLTEYEGTLEENLSFELPDGYVTQESEEENANDKYYIRETADRQETINIYYEGLNSSYDDYYDETVKIDDGTEVGINRFDGLHDKDNVLHCTILHDEESYLLEYQCKETDKDNYYSSCSKEQEDEIVGFIKTFDYHRPDGSDMNALQRLYHNFGISGCVLLALTLLFFVGIPVAIGIGGLTANEGKGGDDAVIRSRDLHESMNRERKARGESDIPSINTVQGTSTNNLARRDHSWSSVPDFFIKLFRRSK